MYILSCCIKLANFKQILSLLKPLMLKFCQSERVKVLIDGQMNTFSDQYNVLLFFMITVMLPQLQFPGQNFIEATISDF